MIRRLATCLVLIAASVAAPASAQTEIGLNRGDLGPQMVSTDILWATHRVDWATAQTTLAADHKAGAGVFELTNPLIVTRGPANNGTIASGEIRLPDGTKASGRIVVGTRTFTAISFRDGADRDWPAGSLVDWPGFNNEGPDRRLAPNLIVDGRDTGYPAGLKPGQRAGWTAISSEGIVLPSGDWTPKAKGTGEVTYQWRFRDGVSGDEQLVRFKAGKPDVKSIRLPRPNAYGLTVSLRSSDARDPLFDLQLLRPGATEATWNPGYLADLAPGRVIRSMDQLGTNNSAVSDWSPDIEEVVGRIVAIANAAKVDPWLNVPHQATDDFVAKLRDFLDARLDPARRYRLEHSNEVWNLYFKQHWYARRHGVALLPVPDDAWRPATAARWVHTPEYTALEIDSPSPLSGGERMVRLEGFADPRLDGVYRGDYGLPDGTRLDGKWRAYYDLQGESLPLPEKEGPVPIGPKGLRWAELSADGAQERWHARRSREIWEIASKGKRFGGGVLGLWAAAGGSESQMDLLLAEYKGKLPAYPILAATAPYLPTPGITDAELAGDRRSISSLTATAGIAMAKGPYSAPGMPASAEHGLKTGDQINIVNAFQPEYCGPTTVTASSPTEFTFPLPEDASPAPASPYLVAAPISFVRLPAYGREVVGIERDGDTLTLTSPRHGLAKGEFVHLSGGSPPWCDGRHAIQSVPTPDTITIVAPGPAGVPVAPGVPDRCVRPWLIRDEAIARLVEGAGGFVRDGFDGRFVAPIASAAKARGLVPAWYEFGYGGDVENAYKMLEPATLAHSAAARDERIGPVIAESLRIAYSRGIREICWYGHAGPRNRFYHGTAKEWLEDDSSTWRAIAAARAAYGTPASGPSLALEPTSTPVRRPTQVRLTPSSPDERIDLKGLVPGVKGGDGASLSDWNGETALLVPGNAPGEITLTLGGRAWRPFIVRPPEPYQIKLDPPTTPAGISRTVVASGLASPADPSRWTIAGGAKLVAVRPKGKDSAELDIDPGTTLGPSVLSDGDGGTATLIVRALPPDEIDGRDHPYFKLVGPWKDWGEGQGGNLQYLLRGEVGTATWTYTAPESGRYLLSATWNGGAGHSATAPYRLTVAGKPAGSYSANQVGGSAGRTIGFEPLGEFDARKGDPIVLTLSGVDTGEVVADAAKFELIAPATDPDVVVPDPPKPEPSEIDKLKATLAEVQAKAEAASLAQAEQIAAIRAEADARAKAQAEAMALLRAEAEAKTKAVDDRIAATEALQRAIDATLERLRAALMPKPE